MICQVMHHAQVACWHRSTPHGFCSVGLAELCITRQLWDPAQPAYEWLTAGASHRDSRRTSSQKVTWPLEFAHHRDSFWKELKANVSPPCSTERGCRHATAGRSEASFNWYGRSSSNYPLHDFPRYSRISLNRIPDVLLLALFAVSAEQLGQDLSGIPAASTHCSEGSNCLEARHQVATTPARPKAEVFVTLTCSAGLHACDT